MARMTVIASAAAVRSALKAGAGAVGSSGAPAAFAAAWGVLGQQRQRGSLSTRGGTGELPSHVGGARRRVGGMHPPVPSPASEMPLGVRSFYAGAVRSKDKDDDAEVEIVEEEVEASGEGGAAEAGEEGGAGASAAEGAEDGAKGGKQSGEPADPKERIKKMVSEMLVVPGDEGAIEFGDELQEILEDMSAEELVDLVGDEDGEGIDSPGALRYEFEDMEVDEAADEQWGVLPETFTPQASMPMLSSEVKKTIHDLHVSDPSKYTHEVLSQRYQIAVSRVKAIIMLQAEEAAMLARGLTDDEKARWKFAEDVDRQMKEDHGVVSSGGQSPYYADDLDPSFMGHTFEAQERARSARPRPLYNLLPTKDAKQLVENIEKYREKVDKGKTPRQRYEAYVDAVAKNETKVVPMEQWHGVKPHASKRFKYCFVDISKDIVGVDRWMVVRETDGSLRAANYDERSRFEQVVNPPVLRQK